LTAYHQSQAEALSQATSVAVAEQLRKGHLVTTEFPRWFKSSYSNNGGQCVEIAANLAASRGIVPVRDSKDPHGPVLTIAPAAWTEFVGSVKAGGLSA
jgi:hypothetical protein